jgi:hypothetical protein
MLSLGPLQFKGHEAVVEPRVFCNLGHLGPRLGWSHLFFKS